ncbi:MAG TPA: ABC transporter ATP-binding protein [Gammaproteobacteria bacterium]|nr:ABC transporter ATP-binding protein [Gammaproteobacteria bacterium]
MQPVTPAIFLKNIHLSYRDEIVFDQFNLHISPGKWTCLLGTSGIGKSTLLKLIAGLIPANVSGEIFRGTILSDKSEPLHQQIAYLPQTDLLQPWLTAMDNALMGHRLRGSISKNILSQTKKLFLLTGLDGAQKKFPYQLSGGMRQRVALIRTLLEEKSVVLMDEPFSALDTLTRFQLQTLAAELLKHHTVLHVTHDPHEALRLAHEIIILSGKPAMPTHVTSLKSETPREMDNAEVIHHQAILFNALTQASGVMA